MKKIQVIILLLVVSINVYADNYDFSSVCSTGQTLFYNITSDSTVTVTFPNYYFQNHSTYTYYYNYQKPVGRIVIPETVLHNNTSYSVTEIDLYAFWACSGIHSVVIPNSIISIGAYAFYGCSGIDSIYLGSGIQSFGYSSLGNCANLSYVYYNIKNGRGGVLSYGGYGASNPYNRDIPLFNTSIHLSKVEIGDSVDTIPVYAFYNTPIDTLIISNSVQHVGDFAYYMSDQSFYFQELYLGSAIRSIGQCSFYNRCSRLPQIIIPESVIQIGDTAFFNCSVTQSLRIGNNVRTIGNYAFYNCPNIDKLYIPDKTENIGTYAFYGCSSVDSIYIGVNISTIGRSAFEGCSNLKWMHYNAKNLQRPLFDAWECNRNGCGWNWGDGSHHVPFLGMNPANFKYLIIGDSVMFVPNSCFDRVSSLDTLVFNAKN